VRRGKGEGSIYRRRDGLWVGQYKIDTPEGRKTKYLYSRDRKEVARRLAKAIADRDGGLVFDSGSLVLGEYLDSWLNVVKETIMYGSFRRYEAICRLHIKPHLGSVRLNQLSPMQVQGLYKIKLDSGLSPRTVVYIHTTLHKSLQQAVKWSLIPVNVVANVDKPKNRSKEVKPLDEEQVRRLLEAAGGNPLESLYLIAVTTGLRQGELLGLKWSDVDLEGGILKVRRTVYNGVINPPKTKKGKRSVTLTKRAIRSLENHPRECEWIFCTKTSTPISCHNLHNRSWKPLLRKAGLPIDTRFHDLRHTAATLLLTKGVHPKIVQEMLGHSSISITLDTYSHVLPNMQEKAVEAMEDIFKDDD